MHLLQHGPRPRGHICAIRLDVVSSNIEYRLFPCRLADNRLAVARFDLERALTAVHQVLVLLADERRRLILHEELSQ